MRVGATASTLMVPVFAMVFVGAAWEYLGRTDKSFHFFVGAPSSIIKELYRMVSHEDLLSDFMLTGAEALVGLILGTTLGATAGLLAFYYRREVPVAIPIVLLVGSVPILALAPLMIIWLGVNFALKVGLAAIATFFVSFAQAVRGARAASRDHLDVLQAMGAQPWQLFKKAIVPGSLDWVFGAMRLNVGFCLLGAFVGEFIASERGLGHIVLKASSLYNMPRALAASIGIVVLAVIFDLLGRFFEAHRDALSQVLSVPRLLWHFSLRARS